MPLEAGVTQTSSEILRETARARLAIVNAVLREVKQMTEDELLHVHRMVNLCLLSCREEKREKQNTQDV